MVTVFTRDGKTHEYATATHRAPHVETAVVNVWRLNPPALVELVAWFPVGEVLRVEYFGRTAVAEVYGMAVQ